MGNMMVKIYNWPDVPNDRSICLPHVASYACALSHLECRDYRVRPRIPSCLVDEPCRNGSTQANRLQTDTKLVLEPLISITLSTLKDWKGPHCAYLDKYITLCLSNGWTKRISSMHIGTDIFLVTTKLENEKITNNKKKTSNLYCNDVRNGRIRV